MYRDTTHQSVEEAVVLLANEHIETWQDEPVAYWVARIMQEVGELASATVGDHDDPPEWEAIQISAICMNFVRKLRREQCMEVVEQD